MCASCPVCHLTLPLPELERHVNDHFEDNEIARDMELAQTIALVSMSALSTMQYELNFSEDLPGTWPSRSEDNLEGCTGKHEEKVNSLVNLQLKSKFYHVEGSLVALLRTCLELDSRNICSIISGHVDHFQSTKSEDFGWGCGWRNIQMLSSHLITQRKDAREVLFGGVGFVPDIPSLQRWLEIGWERGFDTSGAKSFGNKIYGSTKWIGTTECATLLRSFGLRARIVDFECKRVDSLTSLANGLQKKRSMKQVHGPMDKFVKKLHSRSSQINPGECSGAERASFQSSSPYCFQGENSILVNHASSSKCLTKDASDHHALVNWVWNYFASEISCSSANVSVSKKTCKQALVFSA